MALYDVYGCYAINGWRYTDGHKIISSAITLTGQRLLQESIKNMNDYINNENEKATYLLAGLDAEFIDL